MLEALAVAAGDAAYAATDLLHRRTALPLRFRVMAAAADAVEIRTNSPLFEEAVRELKLRQLSLRHNGVARWEIEVEVQSQDEAPSDDASGCETFAFGAGRSIRMSDGSWFAHAPPSPDGVGFVFVAGDERRQVERLRSFVDFVGRFVFEGVAESNCSGLGEAVA